MKKIAAIVLMVLFFVSVFSQTVVASKKKILYIDSYHAEYIWSDDITNGITSVLDERDDIELQIFRMDTKRNKSEAFKKEAAVNARKLIESWEPDVVIASDDNASKYVIAPYCKGTELPVVFCGLNWDASVYGFPTKNITGMVEVALYESVIERLRGFARGEKIGYLASDTVSERKEYENIAKRFDAKLEARFVTTFSELKKAYLELQSQTDMVLIQECRSVEDFNHKEMVEFVTMNTSVPTGALQKYLIHYTLLTYSKVGEEQGEYAAKTALEIIDGKSPQDFPVVANKNAKIYLNMKLAKRIGVKFPVELIEIGHLISAETRKLLYINSYQTGYSWSDMIEVGLLKALGIRVRSDGTFDASQSDVDLKIYRMDTKNNTTKRYKERSALEARAIIGEWKPDIVVTSDDNAMKYLVAPHYKDSDIPFVFCGVNWDASVYGLPAVNITGMVEISAIEKNLELLRSFASGPRLGYIGANVFSAEKEFEYFREKLQISFSDGGLVADFEEWKKLYLRLQNTVDMLFWLPPHGINGWDDDLAYEFVLEHSRIPSSATGDNNIRFALLGTVKIAEEQGWWAGKTALRILEGTDPADIPITTNKESKLYLNMVIARKLGITFPMELIENANLF